VLCRLPKGFAKGHEVSGHDFSRADSVSTDERGLQPVRDVSCNAYSVKCFFSSLFAMMTSIQ
jgi:hypothetical protein